MFMQKKRKLLSDLYSGHSGKHLTAYIPSFAGDLAKLKSYLNEVVEDSEQLLAKEQTPEFIQRFLLPIRRLVNEPELLLGNTSSGWALLRTPNSFRIKRIQSTLPKLSVVSNSFHVKPILKWAQSEKNCYILSINEVEASLFKSDNGSLNYIKSLRLAPKSFENKKMDDQDKVFRLQLKMATVDWIDDWLSDAIGDPTKPLILAGRKDFLSVFRSLSRYPYISKEFIEGEFSSNYIHELRRETNKLLNELAAREMRKAKRSLTRSVFKGHVNFDLRTVSRLAVQGKVQRIFIAEDSYLWGVLDPKDGSIRSHGYQRNCHDDDILDDLAEIVLKNGGDVVLMPKKEMPHHSDVAAIFEGPETPRRELMVEAYDMGVA